DTVGAGAGSHAAPSVGARGVGGRAGVFPGGSRAHVRAPAASVDHGVRRGAAGHAGDEARAPRAREAGRVAPGVRARSGGGVGAPGPWGGAADVVRDGVSGVLSGMAGAMPGVPGRRGPVGIIGAGPAGARAAELLAAGGWEVLLFDPKAPWEKPCGGGIPAHGFIHFPELRELEGRGRWARRARL